MLLLDGGVASATLTTWSHTSRHTCDSLATSLPGHCPPNRRRLCPARRRESDAANRHGIALGHGMPSPCGASKAPEQPTSGTLDRGEPRTSNCPRNRLLGVEVEAGGEIALFCAGMKAAAQSVFSSSARMPSSSTSSTSEATVTSTMTSSSFRPPHSGQVRLTLLTAPPSQGLRECDRRQTTTGRSAMWSMPSPRL